MNVAIAQINPTIGDIPGNIGKILSCIKRGRAAGTDLIIFPELTITGYPPKDLLCRDDFLNQVATALSDVVVPATEGIAILLGCPVREEGKLYNSALLIGGGRLIGRQDKSLLPNYDVFDESRYFRAAHLREPLEWAGLKLGVTICEDIWNDKDSWNRLYDINPVEELIRKGADLIVNISASPYHLGKHSLRLDILQAIAGKYKKGIIYANQVGGNDDLIFDGSSCAVGRSGILSCQAGSFREDFMMFPLEVLCEDGGPGVSPMREDIRWVYQALVMGIKDYLSKTGFKKAVVGLSGGIDSSVTAALAVAALGVDNVLGVSMPSRYSSEGSKDDARQLAENLGIEYRVIPIENMFSSYLEVMNGGLSPVGDLAEENVQARIRGNILMFISNREGYLTLTTGNKSEMAVGYCTLYGDMSGGLAVLADVPKVIVYKIADYINKDDEIVPSSVIQKPPSAELRPGQVDQDSLPPYEILDRILRPYIEDNVSLEGIVSSGFDRDMVLDVIRKVDLAEYKRRQAAPGLRITSKAFGVGRRLPIAQRMQPSCNIIPTPE